MVCGSEDARGKGAFKGRSGWDGFTAWDGFKGCICCTGMWYIVVIGTRGLEVLHRRFLRRRLRYYHIGGLLVWDRGHFAVVDLVLE
jgi:hypothetical protein